MITARYKAVSGTYISVVPDPSSVLPILRLIPKLDLGRPAVPADLHCTVMWGEGVLSPKDQLRVLGNAHPFRATTKALTCWQGHDNSSYLVLELDSPELVRFHRKVKALGITPSFDYKPHITLVSSLPLMKPYSTPLEPVDIMLGGLRIEDAK